MSRIGKNPIIIPAGTDVSVVDGIIRVKGKGGELTQEVHPHVSVEVHDGAVEVTLLSKARRSVPLWGTFASHVKNMIAGVNEPYVKKLTVEGVGYKVNLKGSDLVFDVGFSHPVTITAPEGVTVTTEKNDITISGIDKQVVGQFAADVRGIKPPEPYKGKGIRYVGEVIRRKEGKKAGA